MRAVSWIATGCAVVIIFWIWLGMFAGIAASAGPLGALAFLLLSGFLLWLVVSNIVAGKRAPASGEPGGAERLPYTRRDVRQPPTPASPAGRKALLRPLGWIDAKTLRLANESFAGSKATSAEVWTGGTTFWVAAPATLPLVGPGAAAEVTGFQTVERPSAAAEEGAVFPLARVAWRNPDGTTGSSGWQPVAVV